MALEDYPFRVEKMGPRGEIGHVVCYTDNIAVAHAAFEAAKKQYHPKVGMRLRNRALIIEEHKPKCEARRELRAPMPSQWIS
jgi:hypothetical protein